MKWVNDRKIISINWVTVFKNGPNKICARQLLKFFSWFILEYRDTFMGQIIGQSCTLRDTFRNIFEELQFKNQLQV